MIYDYVVTVKNERRRLIDTISILVIFISAVAFTLVWITGMHRTASNPESWNRAAIFIASGILLLAGLFWSLSRRRHYYNVPFSKLLIIAGITWFAMPFLPWVGLGILLLSFLEKPAKMNLEIGFTKDRVVMNNIWRRTYRWQAFSNVLLKDGMLTLDFKNNRIFQKETIDEEGDAEEEEFNEYCLARLSGSFT